MKNICRQGIFSIMFFCLLAIAAMSVMSGCNKPDNRAQFEGLNISKIETVMTEGFAPFPRKFVRTFDFETGNVTDLLLADENLIPEGEASKYNTPVAVTSFTGDEAKQFIEYIAALGTFDWDDSYVTDDVVYDAGSAQMTILFNDGRKQSTIFRMEYPEGYSDVQSAFEKILGAEMYCTYY